MTLPTSAIPFNINGLAIEDAYTQLDHEISQLEGRLCALRTLRNTLPLISKIPTELLSKIFSHTQERNCLPLHGDLDITTRFFVSWVCRYWRDIALATPTLWTVISKKGREVPLKISFVEALLARSRNQGLSLGLWEPPLDVLRVCIPQMARVQHMRLLLALPSAEVLSLLTQRAPLLSSLDIEYHCPDNLFSGIYPQLRHLTTTDVALQSNSPLITPSLTYLHIIRTPSHISANDLIDILVLLPHLAELVLEDCFLPETGPTHAGRITCPNLQNVSIKDENMSIALSFLACLDIPHVALTVTWPEDAAASEASLRACLILFNRYQSQIPSFQIRHLDIIQTDFDFFFSVSSSPTQNRFSSRFPEHELWEHNIDLIFSCLILDDLKTLSIDMLSPNLVTNFSGLINPRSLTLRRNQVLLDFIAWGGLERKEEVEPLTSLEELTIVWVEQDNLLMEELQQALAARQSRGYGLARLVLERSPTLDPGQFKEHVGTVIVD